MFVPSTVEPFIVLLKDVLTALSIPATAFVAIRGLNTWQRQMVGAATFDLSRTVLRAVFRVRNEVNYYRSPFMSSGEIGTALQEAGVVAADAYDKNNVQDQAVYQRRWKKVAEAMSELEIAALEAEVVWGEDARKIITLMNKPVGSLSVSTNAYLRLNRRSLMRPDGDDRSEQYYAVICSMGEADPFSEELQDVVKQIEAYVRAHTRGVLNIGSSGQDKSLIGKTKAHFRSFPKNKS